MRIAFYFAETFDWTDADLETGLGGAETALVYLARAFTATGCRVAVYNRTSRPGEYGGVIYRHVSTLDPREPWDVFVGVSYVEGLDRLPARVKVHLSMEDGESWVRSYRAVLPHIDAVFAISPHHARLIVKGFGVDPARVQTVPLGVDAGDYAAPLPKEPYKLIYCSVPGCGLLHLAPIFRLVKEQVREATLVVTGDFTLWGHADPGLAACRPAFDGLRGVTFLGRVPRRDLVHHQKTSVLHVYPCSCNELLCLASLECQAAGTPTVAPAAGAFPYTVFDGMTGVLVGIPPADPRAPEAYAAEVVRLLRDRPTLARLAHQARARALGRFTWAAAVQDWTARFEALAAAKP